MKKLLFFSLPVIILGSYFLTRNFGKKNLLKVGNAFLKIETADSPEERSQGLSDRKSLCSDCGLLFIFDQPGFYPFWMRRMNFDIDILWVRDGEVAEITYEAKAPPKEEFESPKTFYQSKVPVEMVLEVNSGWVKENGIKIGDRIDAGGGR